VFVNVNIDKKPKLKLVMKIAEMYALYGGILLTILYVSLMYKFYEWDTAIQLVQDVGAQIHTPIAFPELLTAFVIVCVSLIGYFGIKTKKPLPPIITVLSIAANFIGIIFSVFFIIHIIIPNFDVFLVLFPLNYILLSVVAIKQSKINDTGKVYKNRILIFLNNIAMKFARAPFLAFIISIPLWAIISSILMLFGQSPDSAVKAFTETSGWTFSQKISPPDIPAEPIEHYLCTVAAFGHPKLVKPLRYGKRHGYKIYVNRQLMVANAFEELIAEKSPKFHRFIRNIYDKYGYPLSKHIKNKAASDVTYLLMKPLEWLFVIVLYSFDVKPENRICRQYM
jgi:hypothetical protein